MRNQFASYLTELAKSDPRVVLLMGDIGNKLFDDFKQQFPERFYNCGIAEANMMSVASGLALNGLRPFVYSITPFVTTRCLEQVRVDVCYHKSPVTIVGTGSGLSYTELGPTHHSCEDLAIMRVLPDMSVFAPADSLELRACMKLILSRNSPAYMRIGKKGEPLIHESEPCIRLGSPVEMKSNPEASICLISTGTIAPLAGEVHDALLRLGTLSAWFSLPNIKPLDVPSLVAKIRPYKIIVTIEEHSVIGGIGSLMAETIMDENLSGIRLLKFGVGDWFLHETGTQHYARSRYGLSVDALVARIENCIATF